tara:strand:- start:3313 stop:3429 length:117 start_codon:yes stop_codon:yes gene_type:complete
MKEASNYTITKFSKAEFEDQVKKIYEDYCKVWIETLLI